MLSIILLRTSRYTLNLNLGRIDDDAVYYSSSILDVSSSVVPPHSVHPYSTNTAAAAAAAAPDRSVGVHVVRRERLDGDGKSLALSRVAGRWVPVSGAHHHGSHVAQVFRFEGHFLGKGERYLLRYTNTAVDAYSLIQRYGYSYTASVTRVFNPNCVQR